MNEKFDVIIIGGGVGGLVCGCYLAKEGLKIIIIEQHSKVGGCCSSFARNGYQFDAGVHCLGAMKRGALGKVLEELHLKDDLKINQSDPTYKIVMPDVVTYLRAKPSDTIDEFIKSFPEEKGSIEKFFEFILQKDFINVYSIIKKLTFAQVLDQFFKSKRLKATINVLLSNIGCSATNASALVATILFREYILDLGYYPEGGMQKFSDTIANRFIQYGGKLLLSKKVEKIVTQNNRVSGIICGELRFDSDIVVSNVDATQTFKELLEIKTKESLVVDKLIPSPSMFAVYLGLKDNFNNITKGNLSTLVCSTYDFEDQFICSENNIINEKLPLVSFASPPSYNGMHNNSARSSLVLLVFAPFASNKFWRMNSKALADKMVYAVERVTTPFSNIIEIRELATPYTFRKYTLNLNGAAYGWAPLLGQIKSDLIPHKSSVSGLFLVGHWCTGGTGKSGIPGVALSGRKVAEMVLNNLNKKWEYGIIRS